MADSYNQRRHSITHCCARGLAGLPAEGANCVLWKPVGVDISQFRSLGSSAPTASGIIAPAAVCHDGNALAAQAPPCSRSIWFRQLTECNVGRLVQGCLTQPRNSRLMICARSVPLPPCRAWDWLMGPCYGWSEHIHISETIYAASDCFSLQRTSFRLPTPPHRVRHNLHHARFRHAEQQ
jgi:hypothetical protein